MSRFGALILSIFGSKGVVYHAKGAIKKVTIFRPGLKRGGVQAKSEPLFRNFKDHWGKQQVKF